MSDKQTNPKDAIGVRKAPMSCVPPAVLAELGLAMLEGATKYGRFNFRASGARASVYYDATMRHLFSWWEGEDFDADSDAHLSHITKAIASLTVLRDAMIAGRLTDDRPPKIYDPVLAYSFLNEKAAAIIEQHKDKSPRHYTINNRELET